LNSFATNNPQRVVCNTLKVGLIPRLRNRARWYPHKS